MKSNLLNSEHIKSLYWEKDYNVSEIARKVGISARALHDFMNRNNIPRRLPSEAGYIANKNKPQFRIVGNLDNFKQQLKTAGLMLYWAEGTFSGNTVDFANSNPSMIKIFLRFLREICGVKEERLRVYLYAYSYQNIDNLKLYWHKATGISLKQFTKPYVRRGNANLSKRKLLYGLVHIRYNDKRLLKIIEKWLFEYSNSWTGTQVVNGDRLWLTQHSVERQNEKAGEFREALLG